MDLDQETENAFLNLEIVLSDLRLWRLGFFDHRWIEVAADAARSDKKHFLSHLRAVIERQQARIAELEDEAIARCVADNPNEPEIAGTVRYEMDPSERRRRVATDRHGKPIEFGDDEAPWYPDDSGEWVEWSGGECPVPGNAFVEVLFRSDREEYQADDEN